MKNKIAGSLMLLITTVIWGTTFVAQSVSANYVGPFSFNAARFVIATIVLLPIIFIGKGVNRNAAALPPTRKQNRLLIISGICCGIVIFLASTLSQIGIAQTSVGKAGFITTLYIVMVPVLGMFMGKRVPGYIWCCIAVAVFGMYLLCIHESFSISSGDMLILLAALSTAIHILLIGQISPLVDGIKLTCLQFFVCALLSVAGTLLFEQPSLDSFIAAGLPILYAGVLSCGVAYTLQTLGQRHISPVIASLILSFESVVSVLSGWLLLNERLSAREIAGCVFMFVAVLAAQLLGTLKTQKTRV